MKIENEKKIFVKFHDLNEFVFNLNNLPKWLAYVESLEQITINQEVKGSYLSLKINIFKKNQVFNFRVSEFEKNKKIKLKSIQPFLFEITIKTLQSVDGNSYVILKTKCKAKGFFIFFSRKKLRSKNKFSLEILQGFFGEFK